MDLQEKLVKSGVFADCHGFDDERDEPLWIRQQMLATRQFRPLDSMCDVEYRIAQEDLIDVRSIRG